MESLKHVRRWLSISKQKCAWNMWISSIKVKTSYLWILILILQLWNVPPVRTSPNPVCACSWEYFAVLRTMLLAVQSRWDNGQRWQSQELGAGMKWRLRTLHFIRFWLAAEDGKVNAIVNKNSALGPVFSRRSFSSGHRTWTGVHGIHSAILGSPILWQTALEVLLLILMSEPSKFQAVVISQKFK